ncbi:MAG: hypothetical protein AMXMBFR53_43460 [Gemmatimonadota bacterium]
MRRHRFVALVLAASALAVGCGDALEGPGVLPATIRSPEPLGAVVLEFTGEGILGFEGQGSTLVYSSPLPAEPNRHRVVLVSPGGGTEIRFGIEMADRRGALPAVAAVEAASPTNGVASASGLQVKIER